MTEAATTRRPAEVATPEVTGIIPCHDEASFVAPCLGSVPARDHPSDHVAILVIDGAGTPAM